MEYHAVGFLLLLFTQTAGQGGAEAHSGADEEGDNQGLNGIGVREREESRIVDSGHIDAVHQVVDRLHQHGKHNGPGHADDQPSCGHRAQDVVFSLRTVHRLCAKEYGSQRTRIAAF